jgi:hypothetical protein
LHLYLPVSYLLHSHVDYAVELGLAGIPLPETRSHPEIYFFDIVRQTNTIIFLVDKLFSGQQITSLLFNLTSVAFDLPLFLALRS